MCFGITDQVEHFQAVDEGIDFPHKTLHKDDFAQTNAHVTDFCGKCLWF